MRKLYLYALATLLPFLAIATTRTVCPLTCGYPTISAAIAANNGDTILVNVNIP